MNIHKILNRRQELAYSLRVLLGYPRLRPASDPLAFAGAGPLNQDMLLQLGRIAIELGQDVVVLHFNPADEKLQSISLAIRETVGVRVFTNCQLYAASETAPLQILAEDQAWRVGARNQLHAHKGPASKRLARGYEIARRRWKTAAEMLGPITLAGGRFVPPGATMASTIDMDEAILAAAA